MELCTHIKRNQQCIYAKGNYVDLQSTLQVTSWRSVEEIVKISEKGAEFHSKEKECLDRVYTL